MPEEIAIDQGDDVEKIATTALANELVPVGRISTVPGHCNAKFSADEDGKWRGVIVEDGLAKQCADAMPRSPAVLGGVSGLQV